MQNPLSFLAAVVLFSVTALVANAQDNYFGRSSPEATPVVQIQVTPLPAVPPPPPIATAPPVSLTAGGLRIVTALWGAGRIYADVTAILTEALRQPGMELGVNPTALKGDPVAGTRKDLITVFDWNGIRYVMELPEDANVSFAVLRDFVRARSIAPVAGPAQTLKSKPRTAEQLKSFLTETNWEVGPENSLPTWAITFYPNGVLKARGSTTSSTWSVEGPLTAKLWNKDLATFNADFTRFRVMGDDAVYVGLLKQ